MQPTLTAQPNSHHASPQASRDKSPNTLLPIPIGQGSQVEKSLVRIISDGCRVTVVVGDKSNRRSQGLSAG